MFWVLRSISILFVSLLMLNNNNTINNQAYKRLFGLFDYWHCPLSNFHYSKCFPSWFSSVTSCFLLNTNNRRMTASWLLVTQWPRPLLASDWSAASHPWPLIGRRVFPARSSTLPGAPTSEGGYLAHRGQGRGINNSTQQVSFLTKSHTQQSTVSPTNVNQNHQLELFSPKKSQIIQF